MTRKIKSTLTPISSSNFPISSNVLGRLVALEPAQADLLERICAGHLITVEELETAGALAVEGAGGSEKPKVKSKKKDEQSAGE